MGLLDGLLTQVTASLNGPTGQQSGLVNSVLGMLTLILVPVQLLLVAFAMRGFQQQWNVEIEMPRDDAEGYGRVQPA